MISFDELNGVLYLRRADWLWRHGSRDPNEWQLMGHRDGDIVFRYPCPATGNMDVRDALRIVAALHDLVERYSVPLELPFFTEFWATYSPRIEEPQANLPPEKIAHLGRRYRWCNVRREPENSSQGPQVWYCLVQEELKPDPGEVCLNDLTDFTFDGPIDPRR